MGNPLSGPWSSVELTGADRLALTAAYDQFFTCAAGLPRGDLRTQLLALTPGRVAVAAVGSYSGLVAYLQHPDDAPIRAEVEHLVRAALTSTHYPELRSHP